ncbi:MAG: NAD(P)-dependent oxidoreductase [Paludibacteraceae bacterium]|nr:NAD(P)-dependent oxidoreductase [Paludibacteraceae bacterium]
MTTVFLTGATGTMGWAGMKELLNYPDNYKIRILARPSEKNKRKLAPLASQVEIVWGNLTKYEDVLRGVEGSDIVLHVGGMVSPAADYRPISTLKTNITAAKNIRDAILAQTNQPRLVYIGSVAQMGDRREPLHWGRTGDPICVSAYDHYGITKALAERILTDSGIKRWVSLRQSGILYPAILKNYDPIMFHVPIRGVLEWATIEDSGRLLERVCRQLPDDFWNRYYNIGSGEQYRLSNYEFECLLLKAIGCPKPEQIFNAEWFTTRNFHGMWYADGDVLEQYLHFRANIPVDEYFEQMSRSRSVPAGIRFAKATKAAKLVPHLVKAAMWFMANKPVHGTQTWIKQNNEQRIHAYYGSLEAYKAIPDWKHTDLSHPSDKVVMLDHGYDESKPLSELTLDDMQKAAAFRGGKCLSVQMTKGDLDTQLEWQCAEGHKFKASPRLILLGGHWCPECFPFPYSPEVIEKMSVSGVASRPWQWDAEAKRNPFFAQIWTPLHNAGENNTYDYHIFDGWE